jgi:hypothetical protein
VKTEFPGRQDPEFGKRRWPLAEIGPYCEQDAYMARLLLEQVATWTDENKILIPISAPHMSARIFQKAFVEEAWLPLPKQVRLASMLSYHGGRNYINPLAVGWHPTLNYYDVNSAYTWAMTQMPSMSTGAWLVKREPPEEPNTWGFVRVSGALPMSKVPIVYTHGFRPIIPGSVVTKLWITSMEYDLLREVDPRWYPDKPLSLTWQAALAESSDLSRFAQYMWDRRAACQTQVERLFYKLCANSIYGKFIQRTPDDQDPDMFYEGGLFYPAMASWITGMVRCRMIRAELTYTGLHTATDGLLTYATLPTSKALGEMKHENTGPALVLRNKLYLHWNGDGTLTKWAMHGFQGTLEDLHRFVQGDEPSYHRSRLRGWAEAMRDEVVPYGQLDMTMKLKLDDAVWDRVREEAREEPYRSLSWQLA